MSIIIRGLFKFIFYICYAVVLCTPFGIFLFYVFLDETLRWEYGLDDKEVIGGTALVLLLYMSLLTLGIRALAVSM